jgi:16S rRNA (uracil1498-N3)-methyltransferase
LEAQAIERELPRQLHLAVGMPANERMDFLIEKATELGAASIQPLVTSRSVLRLAGERAAKKVAHWQAISISACEQCGRNRVPVVHAVASFDVWMSALGSSAAHDESRVVLSPGAQLGLSSESTLTTLVLSGPEGGLSSDEEALAVEHHGFVRASLGPRVLRADTAPIAVLVALASSSR